MPHALSGDQSAASRWIGYARFLLTRGEETRSLALAFPSPDHVLGATETPVLRPWRRSVLESVDETALLPPASWVLPISDEDYSPLLAECSDAPCLLFGRGDPSVLTKPAIAIVGSRQPSLDGCHLAEYFAHDLARAGFVIVSGLASGIDTAAHRGAIKAGGKTIAVVATGIDTTYPRSNRPLCEEIVKNGAVVSQFLPASAPRKHHFPRRNRTLSGLSLATVVIEAGVPSGTLITATAAAEQGRDVFALPWSVNHRGGRGCLELLMDGALLALKPADVIRAVNWSQPHTLVLDLDKAAFKDTAHTEALSSYSESSPAKNEAFDLLLAAMGDGYHSAEDLATALSLDIRVVHQALAQLEIDGQLTRQGQAHWTRVCN